MPPPARRGNTTAHGGVTTVGHPTTMIGRQPAARVGDVHTCAMVDRGPKPHGGGPIIPPECPTVLIGGMPGANGANSTEEKAENKDS